MWSSLHAFLRHTLLTYLTTTSSRTVVGPSHLGHEVPDCRVNVHFEEDLSSDCSQPPLWVLRSQKGHVERKGFHIEAHRHVVSLQHEPVSIDCLLEQSSHQSSAEWSSIFRKYATTPAS